MKFYTMMHTRSKPNELLPIMIIKNDIKLFGEDRFRALAEQLSEVFSIPTMQFSTKHTEFYLQLEWIYDAVTKSYEHVWNNCSESFTEKKVTDAIMKLKSGSD